MNTGSEAMAQPALSKKLDPNHVPQKRVFEPGPRHDQTHLFLRPGPKLVVCVHMKHGFYMGSDGSGPVWSHQAGQEGRVIGPHPDHARTVAAFSTEKSARAAMTKSLSAADWAELRFATIQSDVSESGDHDSRISEGPIALCSVEACSAATKHFPPLPHHMLEPHMRKNRR